MKKLIILFTSLTCIIIGTAFKMHTDVYKVDVEKSVLEWYAEKVGGKHNGTIKLSQGEISNNHGNLNGNFEIDMTSIENKDLTNEGSKAKIEKHLKSADFFDTEKFPKATFVITSLTAYDTPTIKGATHKVTGMLTIKDKANEITFDAIVKPEGLKIYCEGTAIVDRSKFDIKYGSKTFFKDIGDKMIYDEFKLKFNIVAERK